MAKRTFGYVRVSSRDQNEDRQVRAMLDFGLEDRNIYIEKQSGKDFNRPVYRQLIQKLREEDVLVVKSIDRLGRNYEEIIQQWRIITKVRNAAIVVLDMPLLDTRRERDLTGTLVADIVLQLLSYVAEQERSFIHQRQREGIDAAKARGVQFGPKRKVPPEVYAQCVRIYQTGGISAREAGRRCGVTHKTFLRWMAEG